MSIVNIETLKQNNCELWFPGSVVTSGTYDDDGNKQGFMILPDGVTVTPTGTFTTQKLKNGQNCLVFDGSTNYITIADHEVWNIGAGNFTFLTWFNFHTFAHQHSILEQYQDNNNIGFFIAINVASGTEFAWKQSGSWVFDLMKSGDISSYTAETWYFISITRNGTYIEMRVNNVYKTSVTYTGTFSNISGTLKIGYNSAGAQYYADGNIKDLMIFKKALSVDQIGSLYNETYIY